MKAISDLFDKSKKLRFRFAIDSNDLALDKNRNFSSQLIIEPIRVLSSKKDFIPKIKINPFDGIYLSFIGQCLNFHKIKNDSMLSQHYIPSIFYLLNILQVTRRRVCF